MLLEVGGAGRGSSRSWPDWCYWLVGAPLGAPRPGWAGLVADSPALRGSQCLGGCPEAAGGPCTWTPIPYAGATGVPEPLALMALSLLHYFGWRKTPE